MERNFFGDVDTSVVAAKKTTPKPVSVAVECLECGKKFRTREFFDVECPKCGGVDVEVA